MPARDRMNQSNYDSPRARSNRSSRRDREDDLDQDFWDVEPEQYDDFADDEAAPDRQARAPRSTRPGHRGGTKEQIDRLRDSLSRSRGSSRQSVGHNHLARASREREPAAEVDDWKDEDEGREHSDTSSRSRPWGDRPPIRQQPHVREFWSDSDDQYGDEDDRFYEDDDDFGEYDAPPRRTPLTHAPSIRLSRPNVSRPSMPSVISQADLVNDAPALAMIGLALLSLVGMAILVANRAETLAPSFATHVSASGVLEDVRGPDALWRLPLLAAMLTLMNMGAAWFVSPVDRFASRFLVAAAIIVQIVAWVALIRIL